MHFDILIILNSIFFIVSFKRNKFFILNTFLCFCKCMPVTNCNFIKKIITCIQIKMFKIIIICKFYLHFKYLSSFLNIFCKISVSDMLLFFMSPSIGCIVRNYCISFFSLHHTFYDNIYPKIKIQNFFCEVPKYIICL